MSSAKWVLVPETATEEMVDAGDAPHIGDGFIGDDEMRERYAAALSARPPVPEAVVDEAYAVFLRGFSACGKSFTEAQRDGVKAVIEYLGGKVG